MDWCIYVGKKASLNYRIGMDKGVWGHKNVFRTSNLNRIKEGDLVYFFHDLKRQTPLVGAERPGNLRIPEDAYSRLAGYAKNVKKCRVTRGYFVASDTVWPDDEYPHRFELEIIESKDNVPVGVEFQGDDVIRNLLRSVTRKGDAVMLGDSKMDVGFSSSEEEFSFDYSGLEGRPIFKLHLTRERDDKIVKKKKELALAAGDLSCEVCGFDFFSAYGVIGKGYIECHHNTPLHERDDNEETRLEELSLVCSNCHRMIHRKRQWLSVEELKRLLNE